MIIELASVCTMIVPISPGPSILAKVTGRWAPSLIGLRKASHLVEVAHVPKLIQTPTLMQNPQLMQDLKLPQSFETSEQISRTTTLGGGRSLLARSHHIITFGVII